MRSLKKKRWKKKKLNIILTIIVCAFGVLIGNYLRIGFAESNDEDYTLVSGFRLYWTLVNLNNPSSGNTSPSTDRTIKHIVFDKYTDDKYGTNGSIKTLEWNSGRNIDLSSTGTIKLFNSRDNETVYILVKDNDKIFFNESSSSMFSGLYELQDINFNNIIDTSKVTDMGMMFDNCRSLKNIDFSNFDTSNVTDMSEMFAACQSLETLDFTYLDTSNVTDMGNMFWVAEIANIDFSKLDTSNVTNMRSMFMMYSGVETLDLSSFDTSNVTNMSMMFYGAEFTSLDLSSFNTSNVTNMSYMFEECANLENIKFGNFNTVNVTNMSSMFNGCPNLKTLDLSSFSTSIVTNMSQMFKDCSNIETIYVSKYEDETQKGWSISNVTSFDDMFTNTPKLVGGNKTSYTTTDLQFAVIDTPSQPGYLTEKVGYTTDLNTTYNIKENKDVVVNFNPGINYITSVYLMNGENRLDLVENTHYTVIDGKLVLKASTLNNLDKVSYKLHVKSKGSLVENIIDLNITDKAIENINKGEVIEDSNAPKTGDAITRYFSLFILSLISFVLLTIMLFTNNKKCKEELEII